jgi:hypothetical protein
MATHARRFTGDVPTPDKGRIVAAWDALSAA